MKKYRRIGPEDGSYEACRVAAATKGRFMCDAVNHNQTGGCPNPACFKYNPEAPDEPAAQNKRR